MKKLRLKVREDFAITEKTEKALVGLVGAVSVLTNLRMDLRFKLYSAGGATVCCPHKLSPPRHIFRECGAVEPGIVQMFSVVTYNRWSPARVSSLQKCGEQPTVYTVTMLPALSLAAAWLLVTSVAAAHRDLATPPVLEAGFRPLEREVEDQVAVETAEVAAGMTVLRLPRPGDRRSFYDAGNTRKRELILPAGSKNVFKQIRLPRHSFLFN